MPAGERFEGEREDRTEQNHERDPQQDEIVAEEGRLARQRGVEPGGGRETPGPRGDQPEPDHQDRHQEPQVHRPHQRLGKGVDGGEDAATGEERPERRQRERPHDEAEVPDLQHASALLDHHRMQERRGHEPRQERHVLHGVPRPVPAPSQDPVGPQRSEDQADREEDPGGQRPPAGQPDPLVGEPPRQQGGQAEGERDGEPDEPQIQEGRVDGHQRVVLEQRKRPSAVGRRHRQPLERRGRAEDQQEIERGDPVHHRQGPGKRLRAAPAEPERDRRDIPGQDEVPQQERSLVGRPQGEHLEERRRGPAGVLRDVLDRVVAGQDGREHGPVCRGDQPQQRVGRGSGALDEQGAFPSRADHRGHQAVDGQDETEEQGEGPQPVHYEHLSSGL